MNPHTGEVTSLLNDLRSGKKDAEAQLFSLVYDELRLVSPPAISVGSVPTRLFRSRNGSGS